MKDFPDAIAEDVLSLLVLLDMLIDNSLTILNCFRVICMEFSMSWFWIISSWDIFMRKFPTMFVTRLSDLLIKSSWSLLKDNWLLGRFTILVATSTNSAFSPIPSILSTKNSLDLKKCRKKIYLLFSLIPNSYKLC